jgi:predicted RNA-binding protein YlqC (UPF0109 family)
MAVKLRLTRVGSKKNPIYRVVAADDVGKVIGRQGRIARALRTLVRASAVREGRRVLVEIADPAA